jgi:hypothetical protein
MLAHSRIPRALALAAALALGTTLGCDNPSCIYGGDCFDDDGGGGPLGSNPASVPSDHAWLLPGAPTITGRLPVGDSIATTSPVVLYFSESMSATSLSQAFQLVSTGGFGVPVPFLPATLVGDGRVLMLLPATPLQPDTTYELRFREDVTAYDLSGTTLGQPADGLVHTFTVAAEDPEAPSVLGSWPLDASVEQGPTGEIAVIFDRAVQPLTVDLGSFAVTVDGATPLANPKPQTLQIPGLGPEPRVWTWRSTGDSGLAEPLAPGGAVSVAISPASQPILAVDGGAPVPPTVFDFTLADFAPPLSAELVSLPTDALGIANLDGSMPLDLAVTIADGLADDRLGAFLIGTSTDEHGDLIALYREFSLSELGYDPDVGFVSLGADELDLTTSLAPLEARFADGTLDVALRLGRAGVFSAVRLLDTDPLDPVPQGALLDTTRPSLIGLGPAGASLEAMRSDLRHIVVSGRATEPVRAAEVSCVLGDNGVLPPVQERDAPFSSELAGLFVAAPVLVDVLDPAQSTQSVTVRIYDRALNAAQTPITALYQQVGASGPAAALPGNPTVTVEVFDAETLLPLPGALVMTHGVGGGAPVPLDATLTLVDGRATLVAAPAGETLVTVDMNVPVLFDLFTFQGVPTAFLSVPMTRSGGAPGILQGSLLGPESSITTLTKWVGDSRLADTAGNAVAVQSCSFNPILSSYECVFGPAGLATGWSGAASYAVLSVPPNEFTYSASAFLKGWDARLPRLPSADGVQDLLDFDFDAPLDSPSTPVEERVLDLPAVDFVATALLAMNLDNLVGGGPRVTVESRLAGLGGGLLSGAGVAFPTSGAPTDEWRLRAAIPGAVDWTVGKYAGDEIGDMLRDGLVTGAPFLRVELRDQTGNRSVRRSRLDSLPAALVPCEPPTVLAPAAGGSTGGASFALTVDDVLAHGPAQPGLYRATLTASDGRRWRVWRPGGAAATVDLWLPPIQGLGGTPLVSGPLQVTVTAVAWPDFDAALFLWTDLARDSDVTAAGAPILLQQP